MSTWISDRRRAAALLTLLLAGCLGGPGVRPGVANETTTFGLSDGAVTLAAPVGYCVDEAATRQDGDTVFALFASCAVLTGAARFAPDGAAGLLTASLGAEGSAVQGEIDALAGFLRSAEGRRTLSRSGVAEDLEIRAEDRRGDLLLMLLRDEGDGPAPALGRGHWRAWFDLDSRLVVVAVYAPGDSPAELARARALIEEFVARIREANAEAPENRSARVLPPHRTAVLLV